nr:MAG TPA: hypothetical protein [Caudoviricetes sp.]
MPSTVAVSILSLLSSISSEKIPYHRSCQIRSLLPFPVLL